MHFTAKSSFPLAVCLLATAHCGGGGPDDESTSLGSGAELTKAAVFHGTPTKPAATSAGPPCRSPGGRPHVAGGSNVIRQMAIYNIGWGSVTAGGSANADTAFLANSSFFKNLGEYGIASGSFVVGQAAGENPRSSLITDNDVLSLLDRLIPGRVPEDDGHILYVIYLPSGVNIDATAAGAGFSCRDNCGYHGHDGRPSKNSKRRYAVLPDPATCGGSCGSEGDREATASHEIAEAATDPDTGGWLDPATGKEIGDICAWQIYSVNGNEVQCEWSNRDNTCIATVQGIGSAAGNCTTAEYNAQNVGFTSYWTCQGNSRYVCDGLGHKVVETCANGCTSEGVAVDDQCNFAAEPACTTAEFSAQNVGSTSYWTCQGNSRYVCDGQSHKVVQGCPNGCIQEGFAVDDQCK